MTKEASVRKALGASGTIYLATLGLVWPMLSQDIPWQVLLYMGGGVAALTFWLLLPFEDAWTKYFSFGSAFLLACFLNRLLYIGDFWLAGERFRETPFFARAPELALYLGEAMTVGGTLITTAVWMLAGGLRHSPTRIFEAPRDKLVGLMVITYVASLVGLVAMRVSPALADASGQLFPELGSLGSVVALVLPRYLARSLGRQASLAVVLSLPFIGYALGTGMKENIILALLPAGFYLWHLASSSLARVALVSGSLLMIGLITAYVGFYRSEVWVRNPGADTQSVFGHFVEDLSSHPTATLSTGVEAFLSRANASVHRGWAMSLADDRGHQPMLVFGPLVYVFIPRIIWPEKPAIRPGWEYTMLVFGSHTNSNSSTAAGFYTSLYLGWGWIPVAVGSVAIGLLIAHLGRAAKRLGGPILVGLYGFALIPFALRLDDTWSTGAFTGPIVQFAYILLLFHVARILTDAIRTRRAEE